MRLSRMTTLAISLVKRRLGVLPTALQVDCQTVGTPGAAQATGWQGGRQHGITGWTFMLLNPFCPFSTARILALRATVLLLLTLLIKAKVRIAAFSALGFALLILQTLIVLAAAGALGVVAAAGGFYAMQQRRTAEI